MTVELDSVPAEAVVCALAAARALEAEGQYSAAKLFRAAALGHAVRVTRHHPGSDTGLERAMAAALAGWRAARGADALAAALDWACGAIRDGRRWMTLDEAPPPFVCRTCGEVFLGDRPPACPRCGARRLTFAEVPPTYFLESLAVEPLLQALRGAAEEVDRLCVGVGDEQAGRGSWPARAIVLHLITAEEVFAGRAWRILDEDDPFLASVPPPVADAGNRAFADLVVGFLTGRERVLTRLSVLSAAQWERTGIHPEWGRITGRQQFSYLAHHEQSHLAELAACCGGARRSEPA
jgi:hypothetical protein